ncbi:MAG TPA: diguanylate cyclase [Longimicrobiaceae bacterium]|nr:diguanylate cyclase [Longimicrobiaceae bacterium]
MARKHQQQSGSPSSVILVVDDSPEVLESTRRLLDNEGHQVHTANCGQAALDFLDKQPVQVIVADYFMPAMTGEELVRRIRESGDTLTQIILATGYSGEKPARVMMQQLDIQGYHDKSEGAQKLLLWVDTAIKSHRHVLAMEKHRKGLRFILDLTPELHRMQPVDELLEALLWQVEALLGAENSFLATLTSGPAAGEDGPPNAECFIALADTPEQLQELQIRVGTGRFLPGVAVRQLAAPVCTLVDSALDTRSPFTEEHCTVVPLVLGQRAIGVIYFDRRTGYAKDQELLEVFASQAAAAIQNALLYDMATVDPLTGTYMRGFATQQLEHSIKRSLRRSDPVSLLMIDLDRFKQVNDEYGHQAGDRALAAVGDLLRQTVRDTDVVGRYGGDEFMVILPETPPAGAMIVAERLLARAQSLVVEVEGVSVPIRLSVGIGSLLKDDSEEEGRVEREQITRAAESLVGSADRALYAAKGTGRAGEMPALQWVDFCLAATPT